MFRGRRRGRAPRSAARPRATWTPGELVPDDIVIGVVGGASGARPTRSSHGFVLDGFPRTLQPGRGARARARRPSRSTLAIDIDVPTEVVLERLVGPAGVRELRRHRTTSTRRPRSDWTCDTCGGDVVQRDDDTEDAISRRLELYEGETVPLIDFYGERGVLVAVDGVGSVDEVFDRMMAALREPPLLDSGRPQSSRPAMITRKTPEQIALHAPGRACGGRDARALHRGGRKPGRDHRRPRPGRPGGASPTAGPGPTSSATTGSRPSSAPRRTT